MVSLWVNRKDASHRYQHMHDAVADLLQLEDYVNAGTKMRIVREDEQPGMLTWPLNK